MDESSEYTVKTYTWEEFKSKEQSARKVSYKKSKAQRNERKNERLEKFLGSAALKRDIVAEMGGAEVFAKAALDCPEVVAIVSAELLSRGFLNESFGRGIKTKRAGDFYQSKAWGAVRYAALMKHGARCQCCGATPADGAVMHVDHIKPRSKFPELALELSNLQVLCHLCNMAKSNIDQTDWSTSNPQESGDFYEYMEDQKRIVRLLKTIK